MLKHALRGDRAIGVPLTLGIGHRWKPRDGSLQLLPDYMVIDRARVAGWGFWDSTWR